MAGLETVTPHPDTTTTKLSGPEKYKTDAGYVDDCDEVSPVEQVQLTVPNTDDPTLPVWTFRMWTLGLFSYGLLSFVNQFFAYQMEPLMVTQDTILVASLAIGRVMASTLPTTQFRIPGFGSRLFSLNPGPFNIKEHVLISIFASAGAAFGNGPAYAVSIVNIIKAFYHRKISFLAGWLLIITTQKEDKRMSREKFFLIALTCSFAWHVVPGYLFPTLTSVSWVCWVFSKTVTPQQLGSGMQGLGVGAMTLNWAGLSSFLFRPLISPFFSIMNKYVGYVVIIYIVTPIAYWGFDLYNASKFPIFSSDLFTSEGQPYNLTAIVNSKFELDLTKYQQQGPIHMSMFFALTYGFGFATIAATLTHVGFFNGKEIYQRFRDSYKGVEDIHTKLMRRYEDIPSWWFYLLLLVTFVISLILCTIMKEQIQMPWWALIFACGMSFIFTLPISIISATTNQTPGLNIITEYAMGLIYPGRPIANVSFKVYGYMSMSQAVSFLNDFKLGHYMKSMFLVQFLGTVFAGTINMAVAWWLLTTIHDVCERDVLPVNSPWICPSDQVFFDSSIIWGLVGPKRIFGTLGSYGTINWFFLGGAIGPILIWLLHKAFHKQSWIPLINLPVLLGAIASMPPATALNYNTMVFVGAIFNYFVFRYRKNWWEKYNYVLSGAMDAGVAFMGILIYFALGKDGISPNWWGTGGEHCDLASCPIAKGVVIDGCPVN